MFLVKYDLTGNVLWSKAMGGIYYDRGNDITTDDSGNVYVTGLFGGISPVIFGSDTLMTYDDFFVVKCDGTGNLVWIKTEDGFSTYGFGIALDTYANVFVTGSFSGSYFIFDTDTLFNSSGSFDIFVAKLNTATVGIKDIRISDNINIFPNPFSTRTTLHSNTPLHNTTLSVYNLFGQQVKQMNNLSGQTITLNRDNLPSGLYFVRLTQGNQVIAVDKLVITD